MTDHDSGEDVTQDRAGNADDRLEPTVVGGSGGTVDSTLAHAGTFQLVEHYRLLGAIGQGGMGVVYRAEDTRFNRHVAVKVLKRSRSEQLSSEGRRRFITEARITAQLQHPGIPAVHDLGTLDDGRPFLVMKLVKGRTLHELLKARPDSASELSRFISIFEQICHAVGYAHSHRVIHRDLKPANVMVGGHGEVQVMDWGLAKVLEQPVDDAPDEARDGSADELPATLLVATEVDTPEQGDSATRTGQTLGTPAYMAPEQAAGEVRRLDARCDVFGIGAILCEILTGEAPYTGADGHAVLLKAVRGDLDDALARLDACDAEPELVELCRRCLAFDKRDRPPDANAVADQVVRIRQDAEHRARRAELEKAEALVREAEQAKRRRHLLIAAAVTVLVLAVGSAGTTIGMLRAERNRRQAVRSRQRAIAERDAKTKALDAERQALRSEATARKQAMAALRFMTDDMVKRNLASQARLSKQKRQYVERVIEYYEGFAKVRGEREDARAIRAEGYYRAGKLQAFLGWNDPAQANFERAVDLYRRLADDPDAKPEYREFLANALTQLAWFHMRKTSRFDTAEKLALEAIAVAGKLVEQSPQNHDYRSLLALSHNNLGNVYYSTSRYADAEVSYKQAIELRRQLVEQFPAVSEYRNNLASSHNSLGNVYYSTSRYADAEVSYKQAIELRQKLVTEFPAVPEYRSTLADSHNNLGVMYWSTSRYADAEASYKQAIELRRKLVAEFPAVSEYRSALADSHNNLGVMYWSTGRYADAEASYKQAIELRRKLVEQFPAVPEYRSDLAGIYNNLGNAYYFTSRYADAEASYKQAIELQRKLVEQFPAVPGYRYGLAGSHLGLGRVYYSSNRHGEAERVFQKAMEEYAATNTRGPDSSAYDVACAAALAAAVVRDNRERDDAERKKLVQHYTDQALRSLRLAVQQGWNDVEHAKTDSDLDALRDLDEFKALIAELEAKHQPESKSEVNDKKKAKNKDEKNAKEEEKRKRTGTRRIGRAKKRTRPHPR